MKKEIRYCDICKKECTGSKGEIGFLPFSLSGPNAVLEVCNSCLRDVRKYVRLKSKNRLPTVDFDE